MLFRVEGLQRQLLAFGERRQLVLERLVFFVLVVLRLLVNLQEAFELQHRASDAEAIVHAACCGVDIDRGLVEDRRIHLRSHKALPDELVNLELVFLQVLLDLFGMTRRPSSDEWPRARPACLSST